ncbi:MAG: hypothetical protein ACLR6B_20580 [Blautia sp.]
MYNNAIQEYATLLKTGIRAKWACSSMRRFMPIWPLPMRDFSLEEAADCLWKSYETVRSNEIYRRYLATIFCSFPGGLRKTPDELKVPKVQREKIEAWLKECRALPEEPETDEKRAMEGGSDLSGRRKLAYHKSTCHPEKDGLPHEGICGGPFCLGRMLGFRG